VLVEIGTPHAFETMATAVEWAKTQTTDTRTRNGV
jgi:hypothetical protein